LCLNNKLKKHKNELLEKGLVLCSEILIKPGVLDIYNLSRLKYNALMKELAEICS
jgi:hypothetical protein